MASRWSITSIRTTYSPSCRVLYTLPLTKNQFRGNCMADRRRSLRLGPVTYMHRASAAELPLAPLGHHLQDSTHTSFGVVTTGFTIDRIKLEASAFNGREPNEQRWSIQLAALDSWSTTGERCASRATGRRSTALDVWSIPKRWSPEASGGRRLRWNTTGRLTQGSWATTLLWGRVHKIANRNESEQLPAGINFEFSRAQLRVHAPGTRRQRRTIPGRRRAFSLRIASVPTRSVASETYFTTGRGNLDWVPISRLLEAVRTGCGLRQLSGIFQVFLRMRPGKSVHTHSE